MRASRQLAIGFWALLWLAVGHLAAEDTTPSPVAGVPAAAAFPPDQIEQLVAPIALYPDALVAQILMASTYPLDVVEAARWVAAHKDLEGEALQKAAAEQEWDPSVTALVYFPQVLDFMSKNLDWTKDLGDAVLAQQPDVTAAIQKLRREAQAAGNLQSTEQQTVETKGDTIIIQPAKPEVVYVPSYTPSAVYGQGEPPATTYYPATYTQPATPAYVPQTTVVATEPSSSYSNGLVGFGLGALAGGLLTAAILWDDHDDWDRIYYGGRGYYGAPGYWGRPNYWSNGWREPPRIDIDRSVQRGDININRGIVGNDIRVGRWQHNPINRGGVRYRSADVRKRYGNVDRDRYVSRDIARGREPGRRVAALPGKGRAPELRADQRKRLDKLGDQPRLGGGSAVAGSVGKKLQGNAPKISQARKPAQAGKAQKRAQTNRPRAKATARTPQAGKPTQKPQAKRGTKRPAKLSPKTKQAVASKRPSTRRTPAKRAASRGGGSSAFKVDRGSKARAASNRGARSRSGGRSARGGSGHRSGRRG
jgi:hypothetical protein